MGTLEKRLWMYELEGVNAVDLDGHCLEGNMVSKCRGRSRTTSDSRWTIDGDEEWVHEAQPVHTTIRARPRLNEVAW